MAVYPKEYRFLEYDAVQPVENLPDVSEAYVAYVECGA